MKKLLLNVGCGKVLLKDFINIDLDTNADLQLNVTEGLPFDDNSVDGIYSEHFIEHLSQSEGVGFLRECRRALKPNGTIRIATPDMEFMMNRYIHADWAEKTELHKYGFDWIANSAEYMNIAMREWGHKWIYNEDELTRALKYAGFYEFTRCELNKSNRLKEFNGLETRASSKLIIESVKVPKKISKNPLVSVLIPAYKHEYFKEALESSIFQTYKNIEIIIFDDSRDDLIEKVVIDLSKRYKNRIIKYKKNKRQFGEKRNSAECWNNSTGELIKFLNDDDTLMPDCIEKMVHLLKQNPQVSLVTSKRDVIDENGNILPDIIPTKLAVNESGVYNGIIAIRTMLDNTINYIGEPSTALFKRDDLIIEYPNDIRSFAGRHLIMNGDVGMWMKLLCRGDLLYIVEPLSQLRIHKGQVQNEQDKFKKGILAWQQAIYDAKRMGIFEKYYPIDWEQNKIAEFQEKIKNKIGLLAGREPENFNKLSLSQEKIHKYKEDNFVSIIIPVYNKIEFTRKCIAAILKNTKPSINYEIIIVDNNSTDETAKYLNTIKEKHAIISVITNSKNLGFSKANNQAAKIAKGDYLLFLNNDTEVLPGWLAELTVIISNDPSVGCVGSKLLFADGTIQHAGVAIWDDRPDNGLPLVARHIYYREKSDFPEANELRQYQVLTGACLLTRKSLYKELNGFDERFWNGYEDVDYCLKIQETGYKLVYQPKSVVMHYESQSGNERFTKVNENITLLLKIWVDKIQYDVINNANNPPTLAKNHKFKKYQLPVTSELPVKDEKLVSIIMLTFNALEYTKKCVDSILTHTKFPFEIIIVDNNSTDGTKKYLRQLSKEYKHITTIFNKKNRGFAAGNNQGVQKSRGDYVMLLNNDVLVSEGWLGSMIGSLDIDNEIGMVGPLTNSISGLQKISDVPYGTDEGFYSYAQTIRKQFSGKLTPRRRIAGFAVLMKKALYEEVKGLDVAYGTGNYEDDDLCLKVRQKGYAIMVDESTFIHHFGSQTFKANKINILKSLEEKGNVFKEKWPDVDYEELLEMKNPLSKLHVKLMNVAIDYLKNEDFENALSSYRQILTDFPIHSEALLGAAMCANQMKEFDIALLNLNKLIQLEPENANALNQSGIAMMGRKDPASAQTAFALAIEKDPDLLDAQRNYGDMLIETGDYENGIQVFQKILENHPNDVASLLYMADLNFETSRIEDCQVLVDRALVIQSDHPLALKFKALLEGSSETTSDFDSDKSVALANEKLAVGETSSASEIYQRVIEKEPRHIAALYGLAIAYQMEEKLQESMKILATIIQYEPDFNEAHTMLGNLALLNNKPDLAVQHFKTSLDINNDQPDVSNALANALIDIEQYDAGVQLLIETLNDYPEHNATLKNLGLLNLEAGKEGEALIYFKKILENNPGEAEIADLIQSIQA